ncbi:MAG: carbon-nitrogen hydrolase [Candidatus Micrarchaeota archaeon]
MTNGNSKFKVALLQMKMSDSVSENLKKAVKMIKSASKKGANIVCLPELFNTPYFPIQEKADALKYAESIPGPTSEVLSIAAKEANVVLVAGSIYEKDSATGKLYNTSMVFDENGLMLGKYRKMHIPHDPGFYEQNYFEKGDLGYKVFQTKYGNVGILICYDQWFPEAARTLALMGADIIFYPTAIGWAKNVEPVEGNWQKAWEGVQVGHAIANNLIIAPVNRCGVEKNTTFWGGSFVSNAFGAILAKGKDKEKIIITECDLAHSKHVREGWRFFYNRRPESYGKLVEK